MVSPNNDSPQLGTLGPCPSPCSRVVSLLQAPLPLAWGRALTGLGRGALTEAAGELTGGPLGTETAPALTGGLNALSTGSVGGGSFDWKPWLGDCTFKFDRRALK